MEGFIIPDFNILAQTYVLQLINIILMLYILSKFIFKPVTSFIDNRKQNIEKKLFEADELKDKNLKLNEKYELEMNNIKSKRYEILKQAEILAKEREKKIISDARKEAEEYIRRRKEAFDNELNLNKVEREKQIVDLANSLASKFIKENLNKEIQGEIIKDDIKKLGEIKWIQ